MNYAEHSLANYQENGIEKICEIKTLNLLKIKKSEFVREKFLIKKSFKVKKGNHSNAEK